MRIIIRIAVILVLLAGLAYGGVWGYSYHKVKTSIDDAVEKSAPLAEIKYKSISVSPRLDGTVAVEGIVIKPKMTDEQFKIQSIRLTLPDSFYLLTAKEHEIPESLRLSLNGIAIDLNSPLFASLRQMQEAAVKEQGEQRASLLWSYDTLGCGDIETIGFYELISMGYQTLEFDIDLNYHYAKLKNRLTLSAAVRMKGMENVDVKAEMRVPPAELVQGGLNNAVVDSIRIEKSDAGYAALRNRFCAAQLKSNEDAYLLKNTEMLSRELGSTFPLETIEAYKKVMQGGRMSLDITPKAGTEFATLNRFELKDVIDILGAKLTLDSHQVDFTKFEWGKSFSADNPVTTKAAKSAAARPVYVPPAYHPTAPSQLGRYDGYKVRLKTNKGMEREGVISDTEAGAITLQQNVPTKGFITFRIALEEITYAEVFY